MALGIGSCVCEIETGALVPEGPQGQMVWARGQDVIVSPRSSSGALAFDGNFE